MAGKYKKAIIIDSAIALALILVLSIMMCIGSIGGVFGVASTVIGFSSFVISFFLIIVYVLSLVAGCVYNKGIPK